MNSPSAVVPLRIVLVDTRNPLNIGAAARAMSNFGFLEMRLVNPYHVAFREARSAVKSQHVLRAAREFDSVAEAVADCALVVGTTSRGPRVLEHPLRRLEQGARMMTRKLASAPVALLFGSEKFGLSNDDLSHCHWLMRIPTREEHGSMNLGQAVAVCLYEMVRQAPRSLAQPPAKPPSKAEDLERITLLLEEVLACAGYVHAPVEVSTRLKLRRLVRRMELNQHDAKVWLGMLRQMRWKLLGEAPGQTRRPGPAQTGTLKTT